MVAIVVAWIAGVSSGAIGDEGARWAAYGNLLACVIVAGGLVRSLREAISRMSSSIEAKALDSALREVIRKLDVEKTSSGL